MAEKTTTHTAPVSRSGLPKVRITDPEYTLSLIGMISSIAGQSVVGIVLSVIGLKHSKAEGRSNMFALLGLIFGIIAISLWLLFIALYLIALVVFTASGEQF